jgi:hypothetical protein
LQTVFFGIFEQSGDCENPMAISWIKHSIPISPGTDFIYFVEQFIFQVPQIAEPGMQNIHTGTLFGHCPERAWQSDPSVCRDYYYALC